MIIYPFGIVLRDLKKLDDMRGVRVGVQEALLGPAHVPG